MIKNKETKKIYTKLKKQAVIFRTVKILKTSNSQSQDLAGTDKVLKLEEEVWINKEAPKRL